MNTPKSTASPRKGTQLHLAECEWCGKVIARKGTNPWAHYDTYATECA